MGMRVMLADGQPETRSALRLLLEQEQDVEVVAEAAWSDALLTQIDGFQPDMLLLDWGLPGLRTVDLLPALRTCCPHLRVIALSTRPELARQALAAGVDAFVSKGEPPESLLEAIRGLGERMDDPSGTGRTPESYTVPGDRAGRNSSPRAVEPSERS